MAIPSCSQFRICLFRIAGISKAVFFLFLLACFGHAGQFADSQVPPPAVAPSVEVGTASAGVALSKVSDKDERDAILNKEKERMASIQPPNPQDLLQIPLEVDEALLSQLNALYSSKVSTIPRYDFYPNSIEYYQHLSWSLPFIFGGFKKRINMDLTMAGLGKFLGDKSIDMVEISSQSVPESTTKQIPANLFYHNCQAAAAAAAKGGSSSSGGTNNNNNNNKNGESKMGNISWSAEIPIEVGSAIVYPLFAEQARISFVGSLLFTSCYTQESPLHYDTVDLITYITEGSALYVLVAPWQAHLVYPSKFKTFAQVNPMKPDYQRFPRFKEASVYLVELKAGEALVIPAFWYRYVQTTPGTVGYSLWWQCSSKMLELLMLKALNQSDEMLQSHISNAVYFFNPIDDGQYSHPDRFATDSLLPEDTRPRVNVEDFLQRHIEQHQHELLTRFQHFFDKQHGDNNHNHNNNEGDDGSGSQAKLSRDELERLMEGLDMDNFDDDSDADIENDKDEVDVDDESGGEKFGHASDDIHNSIKHDEL